MAVKSILGTAVRHPLASTALVAGVAKGTLVVVRRLARGESPIKASDLPDEAQTATATATVREPEVVPQDALDRDLPEPVVIQAEADEPEPQPDYSGHVELEEELVWTSESPQASE